MIDMAQFQYDDMYAPTIPYHTMVVLNCVDFKSRVEVSLGKNRDEKMNTVFKGDEWRMDANDVR